MPDKDLSAPVTGGEWNGRVGQMWAEEWARTDRAFAPLTTILLEPNAIGSFTAAVDIGCGAGEVTGLLAGRDPAARVQGIDISHELIGVARQRWAHCANAHFDIADAAAWSPIGAPPDLLVSRHGVMFFADPITAFIHFRRVAAPAARLRFSCFRRLVDNEWAQALASIVPVPAGPSDPDHHAPGPFAFGDSDRVRAILSAAGWADIAFEAVDYAMVAGAGANAIDDASTYFQRIGPAARALAELPEAQRANSIQRLRDVLAGYAAGTGVALPAAAWIVSARAP